MGYSLEQVLGYVSLTGTIQATTTGIPNPYPDGFMNIKKPVVGDKGRYTRIKGTRRTARLAMYGAPAVQRELKDVAYEDVKLMHTFESMNIDPLLIQALRNYNNYDLQQRGVQELARQVAEWKMYFQNLRIATIGQTLALGAIYYDGSGNFLPSSSGAVVSATFGMNANNQNQLNGILATTWSNPTADIPNQLRVLKQTAAELTGYPLKVALYGRNVPSYLTNNDYVLDYLARSPNMREQFLDSGEIPNGLFGFQWVPIYTAFFEDQTGANQLIWNNDAVTFTPEPSADWWEILEGTYQVPTSINIQTDANQAMGSLREVVGMFGYSMVTHNPPTIQSYFGDTFLPVIKVPDAIYQGIVKF